RAPSASSWRVRGEIGVVGSGSPGIPMNVPFVEPRSSMYQRPLSSVSSACVCDTEPSAEQSICGLTLRLRELRPISALLLRSGKIAGAPLVGLCPATSCAANQSGSTHSSAIHAVLGVDGVDGGSGSGAGSWPVVKSYPQLSQNSAS